MGLCSDLFWLLTTQIRDFVGHSREVERHVAKMEERARQEEELFNRVPLTKEERKREKYLKKSRNGYDECLECLSDISTVFIELNVCFHFHLYTFFST